MPTPIKKLEAYLSKFIINIPQFSHDKELRKNIAYNLQYLQFQEQILAEFKITTVILTQTWKVNIIIGTAIIEAVLYYLLVSKDLQKSKQWKELSTFKANEKVIDSEKFKIESVLFRKLGTPESDEMSLNSMIQKAERNKLLGESEEIYKKLNYLRKLRNKVHIHDIEKSWDTDWTKFNAKEINTMRIVLRSFMLSSLFSPTDEEKTMFDFLKTT